MMAASLRVALCQMAVGASKEANIARAVEAISKAKKADARLIVLPECFNCPYGTKYFAEYAEELPPVGTAAAECEASTPSAIAQAARAHRVWVVAGSIPERDASDGALYNSSMTFCPNGVLRAVHRKMHLFRINTPEVTFDEAEVLTPGNAPTVVDAGGDEEQALGVKLGIGICFDIRYPQLASFYHDAGTGLLVYPGAFNMVTGPKHWTLCARARAVDTQQYALLCSPARDTSAGYVAYGHSLVVDPWGEVVAEANGGDEEIVFADVNLNLGAEVKQKLPISAGVRSDLYRTEWQHK